MHASRYQRTGDPLYHPEGSREATDERFWSRVNKTETCWLWTGRQTEGGYGWFTIGQRQVRAHRFAFYNGDIPVGGPGEGGLDHLCRVRLCVRPEHLEEVTQAENNRRAETVAAMRAAKAEKYRTHCRQGHPRIPENTWCSKTGITACRPCRRERYRRKREGSHIAT
jgi:hypothetical protein